MDEGKRRVLLLKERDKHLSQLMAINGRAAFGVLTLFAGIVIGAKDIGQLHLSKEKATLVCALILIAAGVLAYGAYLMSRFHTDRIREFEDKVAALEQTKDVGFRIIPRPEAAGRVYAFSWIFGGTLLLMGSILVLLFFILQ